jgi:hypothetical protein
MSMFFDAEKVMLEVKDYLRDPVLGINARIIENNTDNNPTDAFNYNGYTITLDQIDIDNAVYFLVQNQKVINFPVFLGITIEKYEIDDLGGVNLAIGIKITVLDRADWAVDVRALRYLECLYNVFERRRYFGGLKFSKTVLIEPKIALDTQSRKAYREIGISLKQYFPA